jgi:Plastocyanin
MKAKILLSLLLLSTSSICFSTTWQVTNSGLTFSPSAITINFGDDVNFTLESIHNVVEVTKATWDANGNTSNGGFQLGFGGGLVPVSQLAVGIHYYVCSPHASLGMKGTITVVGSTGVDDIKAQPAVSLTPNPASDFILITANDNKLIGANYFLLDQVGRQVLKGKLMDTNTSVAIKKLASGLYFLQIGDIKKDIFKVLISN